MFRPDCIWVWIFSTTSPSWMMSWVTLIPVISVNALARVFDSYSWVVMVSETTLISMPLKGTAALMNHSISFSCSSLVSVEGWNSLSIHRFAAFRSAPDGTEATSTVRARVIADSVRLISNLLVRCRRTFTASSGPGASSHPAEHHEGVHGREAGCPPEIRSHESEPAQMDEGAAQQRDEQPVAPRGGQTKHADPLHLGTEDAEHRHEREQARQQPEEHPRLPRPRHPREIHDASSHPPEREALGDVVADEPDDQRAGHHG